MNSGKKRGKYERILRKNGRSKSGEGIMKTGLFATLAETSKDTIRYYIKEGLLIPAAKGYQLEFTETDLEVMYLIKNYRNAGFSIDEIQCHLTRPA